MINARVNTLRAWMQEQGIQALVVPTMDPHNSEYVAERWQCRRWITGFTGSAGTAVITLDKARLWTDSRYWLQAAEQLADTPFLLMREGEVESPAQWMAAERLEHVAFPADMMTPELYAELFAGIGAQPCPTDPFDLFWTDRPAFPYSEAEVVPAHVAGERAESKLERLTTWMQQQGHDQLFVSDLSEIAWLLNLRGDDIPYNPYLISFFRASTSGAHTLFIEARQVTPEVAEYLAALHIEVRPYAEGLALQQAAITAAPVECPVAAWRAIKNATEQAGFRAAHVRDGVAMVRFLCWLDQQSAGGFREPVTEIDVDRQLTAFRAQQDGFCGLSFETIAAYGSHGAIVHYEATPETDVPLAPRGLLLLDSGAHYASADSVHGFCGTTDITRTIALGPLTEEERRVYTLVLKGHLQLAHLQFPDGMTGLQLDTPARMAMWREGYDFGHGTGHGVGHRLGVHEGPVQIRKNLRGCTTLPFHAGQNITDEPGIYVPGRFGVRIENLLFAVPAAETDFGRFLRFESCTLCPYDLRPVVVEMLTPEERQWLNAYHARVREALLPLLPTETERQWLEKATEMIK